MSRSDMIFIIVVLATVLYVGLIRPKIQQRQAIKENREWLFKKMGITDETSSKHDDAKNYPVGTQVITDIREYWGYPPKQEQVMEEIYPKSEIGGNWDFAVHFHEASEQYLGSKIFNSLPKRFASIAGVDDCSQEDREVYLIITKKLDTDKLRAAIWQKYLEAAKEALEKSK